MIGGETTVSAGSLPTAPWTIAFSFVSTRGGAASVIRSDGSSACAKPIGAKAMPTEPYSRSDLDLARIDWRVDATTDEAITRQAEADADTAPVFTAEEILPAGRRIRPEDVADVRALRTRLGLSQEAFAARFGFSVDASR
jgi:hypothetical protein